MTPTKEQLEEFSNAVQAVVDAMAAAQELADRYGLEFKIIPKEEPADSDDNYWSSSGVC